MSEAMTRGVLFVHSAPSALCPHIEWAIGSVVEQRTDLHWSEQNAAPGMSRAEVNWTGKPGTGALLASALRGWAHLRYEVTEEASPVSIPAVGPTPRSWESSTPQRTPPATSWSARNASVGPTKRAQAILPSFTRNCPSPWERPGTRNSSPSVMRQRVRRCAGSTRSSNYAFHQALPSIPGFGSTKRQLFQVEPRPGILHRCGVLVFSARYRLYCRKPCGNLVEFPPSGRRRETRTEHGMGLIHIDLFTTLDGVAQAPGGPDEDPESGFKFGGWQAPLWDEVVDEQVNSGMAEWTHCCSGAGPTISSPPTGPSHEEGAEGNVA